MLWGVRGVYKLIVGLKEKEGGQIYEMWRRHKLKLTERAKSRWSMLVSESRSCPASDVLCVDASGPRYMLLVETMSMRDKRGVISDAQKTIVFVGHDGRGARKGDREWGRGELRSAKWMVVVEERKVGRGISADLGGLLGQEPVQRKLPVISQESGEGLTEADVDESV